jgi:hypothetical protein
VTIQEQPRAEVGEHRGVCAADRLCQACVSVLDVDAAAISSVFDGTNTGALGASGAPTASDENGVTSIMHELPSNSLSHNTLQATS